MIIFGENEKLDSSFLSILNKDAQLGVIKNYCPAMVNQLIVDNQGNYQSITFQGVMPQKYNLVTNVSQKFSNLSSNKKNAKFEDLLSCTNVIVGEKLAQSLNLKIKDELKVLIPTIKGKRVLLKERVVKIAATINTGFDEYDKTLIVGSLDLFVKLFGEQKNYDFVMVKINKKIGQTPIQINKYKFLIEKISSLSPIKFYDESFVAVSRLKTYYSNFKVLHWKELSPNLMASMDLEKIIINLVILLILLVGLINMISLIYIKIQTKKRDIAILLTLGMKASEIKSVFVKLGLLISVGASILGEALAYVAGILLSKYDLIKLPDAYYVQTLPVNMDFKIFLGVFIFTNIATYLASKIPTSSITDMNVSAVLRN
jgi:ABC-type lipoprotein release transport system permease subunit